MKDILKMGIDVGSTTVKTVIMDSANSIIFKEYRRHFSDVKKTLQDVLGEVKDSLGDICVKAVITGSGGIGLAKRLKLKFEQEVISSTKAIETYYPETDVVIELGGEDAKVTYLKNGIDQRMNGICAGGTGSFIDQMASLLMTDAGGLNELAKDYETIYPIASRCGVFAKTDIQPLLNEGAKKTDLAMSIFNAVVIQTVSVLSCGRKIEGNVAFLGGPLFYLSELRAAFARVLKLKPENIIFPENAQLYVALGAALLSENEKEERLSTLIDYLKLPGSIDENASTVIEPLFKNEEELQEFRERHARDSVNILELEKASGNLYLGIDAGSTTTKAVLIDEDNNIVYSHYGSNEGSPLNTSIGILTDIYGKLPENAQIVYATVTGYGEELIKKALRLDRGEIETIAHYKGAKYFKNDVNFILDIGGQDMKCLEIKNGVINKIILNEACSSGCGSFLETFAKSLSMNIIDFAQEGIKSDKPIDLGSRCTVFMNSRVKQAQKEGATVADISSGLAYSVVKNALFKVVKLRDVEELGENVVVQGGTFYNDLVLRAFEKLTGKDVVRPNIAGIMGAFGCALISKENYEKGYKTNLMDLDEINSITVTTDVKRCSGCTNRCLVTINKFSEDEIFVSGNRCEVGEAIFTHKKIDKDKEAVNLYTYKYNRIFAYKPLDEDKAKRGKIGIVRALNMYENYPFWFRLLTELGFSVRLSKKSSKSLYEKGIESIASDTVCYPAKLVHGHIENLIETGIDTIFYPMVNYEIKEDDKADNHYNCPVVSSYPEVIKNNVDNIRLSNIRYINPVISLNDPSQLVKRLYDTFRFYYGDIKKSEIKNAVEKAYEELENYRNEISEIGEKAVKELIETKKPAIILSGRPYHIDPEINHGIPELINSLGFAVLSEDSIINMVEERAKLRVVDQWVYHSRLYKAAKFILDKENFELVQLNSFGCGLDAITTEQVEEILDKAGKIHTVIKIDEGNNLGAAKIRLRSLKAAIEDRKKHDRKTGFNLGEHAEISMYDSFSDLEPEKQDKIRKDFSKKDIEISPDDSVEDIIRKANELEIGIFGNELDEAYEKNTKLNPDHVLLAPQMAPIQFQFLEQAVRDSGLRVEVLKNDTPDVIDEGLRYVNNDACYPAILVVGQFISALKSGKYDLDNTSVLITQTGGGCRATNYIGFLRKAMKDAGFGKVPVVSLNVNGTEDNGLKEHFSLKMGIRLLMGLIYGEILMKVLLRTRPYEKVENSANELYEKWCEKCKAALRNPDFKEFKNNIKDIVKDFDNFDIDETVTKPKVGLVGEILVKFNPLANNDLIGIIENEGAEAVVPELTNFFTACAFNTIYKHDKLEGSFKAKMFGKAFVKIIDVFMKTYNEALENSNRFKQPWKIQKLAKNTIPVVSIGNQTGEGWLLTGEMIELLEEGVDNIICMQPFGCLPNHIIGKGSIKELKRRYENANIIPIDYDASASSVNQLNRIKLMLSNAFTNMEEKTK